MDWDRSRAAIVGVVVGLALLVVGAFAGRPDVAVLGAAPVVAGFWDWRRRPASAADRARRAPSAAPADAGTLRAGRGRRRPSDAVLVGVRRGLRDIAEVLVAVDGTRTLPITVHTVRTGPQEVAVVDVQGVGPGRGERLGAVGARRRERRWCCPSPRPLGDAARCRPACAG